MATRFPMRPKRAAATIGRVCSKKSMGAFFATLVFLLGFCALTINYKSGLKQAYMERLITEKIIGINQVISRFVYKTQALAAFVIQGGGEVVDFERTAAAILDDPAILNILVAPGGTVAHVYPLEGNERVIGFNLLGKGRGNKEAIAAAEREDLVFSGPFELMQGGVGFAGRFPVILDSPTGGKYFWGLVSVTLKYPDALAGAGLESLSRAGLAYELWRINPDDGKRQVIMCSPGTYDANARFIERRLSMFNAEWYFRILSVRAWYEIAENWAMIAVAFFVSALVASSVRNNERLVHLQGELREMLRKDPLTGLLNRRGLFQELQAMVDAQLPFSVFYFDLNYFKQINDTLGHITGDHVLVEFGQRVQRHLPPDAVFSRVGGDEFILALAHREDEAFERALWRAIADSFTEPVYNAGGKSVVLSFSVGRAVFPDDGTSVDALLTGADLRMYEKKHEKYSREQRRRVSDVPQCIHTGSPEG